MLGEYIKAEYFIISFAIGILYVYLVQPPKEVVYRFPNPNNVNNLVYTDKNDNCYKYKLEEKIAVMLKEDIKSQPIVEDFKKIKNYIK